MEYAVIELCTEERNEIIASKSITWNSKVWEVYYMKMKHIFPEK